MIDDKVDHLWSQDLAFDARAFTGLKRILMRGFDIASLAGIDAGLGELEAARAWFRWRDDDTEEAETRQTGAGLMLWCALADLTDAVRALISAAGHGVKDVVNRRLLIHRPDLFSFFHRFVTPLHAAAAFGSSATVTLLLEAGANPRAKTVKSYDILMCAVVFYGEPNMFKMWAERFPKWDWNWGDPKLFGLPLFGGAVRFGAEHKRDMMEALVAIGANPVYFAATGAHTLIGMATNPDISTDTVRYLLSLPGVKDLVNVPMRPRTATWRFRYKLTRLLVRLGNKKGVIRATSQWDGQTALCSAALNGNWVAMKMLVCEGGADTQARNARGLSALDQGRLAAGNGFYHPLLQPTTFISRVEEAEEEGE